jgi:hypothetical protein
MKWYWYVARNDELMIDCDGAILLEIAQKRLERSGLSVKGIFITPSFSEDHYHLVVRLSKPMGTIERQVWQLFLMDHTYRSVNNLFRALAKIPAPCLLISPERKWLWTSPWKPGLSDRFWRQPDAICECKEKHKGPNLSGCKIGLKLRGYSDAPNNLRLGTNK